MTALSGKVQSFDGTNKVFMFDDVQAAVLELKARVRGYCKGKLIINYLGDLNALIDGSFSDVINNVTTELKGSLKGEEKT